MWGVRVGMIFGRQLFNPDPEILTFFAEKGAIFAWLFHNEHTYCCFKLVHVLF